jgi:NADPH:quinone reductase-like Zn-dependent oxidoreductase
MMPRHAADLAARDLTDVVEAVGARGTRFRPGQEVYGTCERGSFAE